MSIYKIWFSLLCSRLKILKCSFEKTLRLNLKILHNCHLLTTFEIYGRYEYSCYGDSNSIVNSNAFLVYLQYTRTCRSTHFIWPNFCECIYSYLRFSTQIDMGERIVRLSFAITERLTPNIFTVVKIIVVKIITLDL